MSSTYIAGYRIGMLIAGAGSLYIASLFGSEMGSYNYHAWQVTYASMAAIMLIGVLTTLIINEPESNRDKQNKYSSNVYIKFFAIFLIAAAGFVISFLLSADVATNWKNELNLLLNNYAISSFCIELLRLSLGASVAILITLTSIKTKVIDRQVIMESYAAPVIDFFQRYGIKLAIILLALIGLYRISDIVLGVISNIFYQDLGYSKIEIASIVKTFGLFMTLLGGFLGGILSVRFGVMKILFVGALLTVLTNLLFMLLAIKGYNIHLLYFVISADNLSAGIASAAFVAFLSRLVNVSFTAMQFAIFTSLMTLIPKLIGGYSGSIVENIGYTQFFFVASLIGVPVLWIIYLANKHLKFD
jgi:PAT family beta-lactamase induction signal transducer AmpG